MTVLSGDREFIVSSPDGENWEIIKETSEVINKVRFINGKFIFGGNRKITILDESGKWQEKSFHQNYNFQDFLWDGEQYIASFGTQLGYSKDLESWTEGERIYDDIGGMISHHSSNDCCR